MNFENASKLRQDLLNLIGRKIDTLTIDEVVIAPIEDREFKQFAHIYLRTYNAELAIQPFMESELTVKFIFNKKDIDNSGLFLHGTAIVDAKKLGINLDLAKYGI